MILIGFITLAVLQRQTSTHKPSIPSPRIARSLPTDPTSPNQILMTNPCPGAKGTPASIPNHLPMRPCNPIIVGYSTQIGDPGLLPPYCKSDTIASRCNPLVLSHSSRGGCPRNCNNAPGGIFIVVGGRSLFLFLLVKSWGWGNRFLIFWTDIYLSDWLHSCTRKLYCV